MKKIKLLAWLKNNKEWYYPQKPLSLSDYENYEIINFMDEKNFLVYAWDKDKQKDGRLFLAEYV